MALKYANAVYPFSSVFARYICLLGSSNTAAKLEVQEESSRGLRPFLRTKTGFYTGNNNDVVPASTLPSFCELIDYIKTHRPSDDYVYQSKTPVVNGYPLEVYSEILRFLRLVLVLEANPDTILIDEYVESKVENGMSEDPVVMSNFRKLIGSWWASEQHGALEAWLQLIENALDQNLKGRKGSIRYKDLLLT